MNEFDGKLYALPQTAEEIEHNLRLLGPERVLPRPSHLRAVGRLDRLGRKELGRLRILPDYLLLVARIDPTRVRRVPAIAVAEEGVDDQGDFALLNCPCNAHPIVRASLDKCSGCERFYVLNGPGRVWVAYGSMTPPELPAPVAR